MFAVFPTVCGISRKPSVLSQKVGAISELDFNEYRIVVQKSSGCSIGLGISADCDNGPSRGIDVGHYLFCGPISHSDAGTRVSRPPSVRD